jgi:hypothetical protein
MTNNKLEAEAGKKKLEELGLDAEQVRVIELELEETE